MFWNWAAIAACVLPVFGGLVNAIRNREGVNGWFKTLKKPSWTPPSIVFGTFWTCLYSGMGYASYLVWRDAGRSFRGVATLPLTLYAAQLALSWAWSGIFFRRHHLKLSVYAIILMDMAVFACGFEFFKVNHTAGYFMVPYLGWGLFVTALVYRIYKDNPVQVLWRE